MTQHTGKYEVATRREVHGHKKGEVFELTAERGLIGVLVTSGLIKPAKETGDAGTHEGK